MSEITVASRYAKALIDLAEENNSLEATYADMVAFEKVVDDNPVLEAVLKNPIIPLDKKKGILREIFSGQLSKVSSSFLDIVINKGRSAILFETSKQFVRQYNIIKGVFTAHVTSAVTLTNTAKQEIIDLVKKDFSANEVIVEEKVNPDLIGGFILRVGDRQFDGSISHGLDKLRKELGV